MNVDKYKKTGQFTLTSGAQTSVYYDIKEAMGEPQNLYDMAEEIALRLTKKPDVIIGLDYGGIPLAVALSLQLRIPYAVLRKEQKKYGTRKRIEGYQGKGRVLLVDDVTNTGASLDAAYAYLKSVGYDVIQVESYYVREEQ